MSRLEQVKVKGQKVSEAISTVLKMEVEIIDDQLVRIAGTGKVQCEVGARLLRGLVNKHVIKTGEHIFISSAGHHPICSDCPLTGNCFYKASIVYPIKVDSHTIGTISLIAFDEEQRRTLCSSSDSLIEFITRMGDLIGSKVLERETYSEKMLVANQLKALLDSVYQGVMAIDEDGTLTHFNTSAEKMWGISRKNILGKKIEQVFPKIPLPNVLKEGKGYTSKEILVKFNNKQYHFISTAKPILDEDGNIAGAVATFKDYSEAQVVAYKMLARQHKITFDNIIGNSKALKRIIAKAEKIAGSNSTVMILGESGTGKEVFARAIHEASSHANHPFIAINCGAIPETLLESELFGYDEGAFTGAKRGGKPGKFEIANGGTLLLDEVGNMSLYLQAKLLRVLQEKQIERVGSNRIIPVEVRIIAATNGDLQKMVARGEFREDLYYRLSVIPLTIPPLRERREDIPQLLSFYLERYNTLLGKNIAGFSPKAMQSCYDYSWPGNVRELVNAVEYAVNIEEGEQISYESLPPRIKKGSHRNGSEDLNGDSLITIPTLEQIEKETIAKALNHFGWSEEGKEKAAQALGISRATIYRKINKFKLKP